MAGRPIVFSQTRDGAQVYQFPLAADLTYGFRLNRPGSMTFSLPNRRLPNGETLDRVLRVGVHEVGVKEDNRTVWLGPLLTVEEEPTDRPGMVSFAAEGLMAYLRKGYITTPLEGATTVPTPEDPADPLGPLYPPGRLVDVDDHLILKRIVDHVQAKAGADWHFNTATLTGGGQVRTRGYDPLERKEAMEAITQLCEVINGPDFEVDPATRNCYAWTPQRGTIRTDVTLTNHNIRSLTRSADATEQASEVLGIGAGEGDAGLYYNEADSVAVAEYGRTQWVYVNKDISEMGTLEEHVQDELAVHREPPQLYTVTVVYRSGMFELGDVLRIKYSSGYGVINEQRRLIGYDVNRDDDSATLFLDRMA